MDFVIALEPETVRRVRAAQNQGFDISALVRGVLDALPPVPASEALPAPDAENQALIRLIESWQTEDATEDEGELARRDRENEEFMAGINEERALAGARRIY